MRGKKAILIGTDEVGRGCLAGPVVAAAVILPPIRTGSKLSQSLEDLNDSKQLSSQKRERLAETIHQHALCAIADATVEEIETINILKASLLAMSRAVNQLLDVHENPMANFLVAIDGNKKISNLQIEQVTVIDGDSHSASIAAASVIAKVYRDRMMRELARQFPQYLWESNKGYASAAHRDAIKEHGPTLWHRKTFLDRVLNEQLTLQFD
ncbi:MAG: ribonuclease HII [Candidatus Melainabacteria bacterium]|nr:ribonuclease HII [Candidatus Melainabacteria bacterium]